MASLALTSSVRVAWAAGTEGASFLDIPVGGAPAAFGSAYTAHANDAYAPVWNPAGLGFLDVPQIAGMHLNYLESLRYEFASAALPFGKDTHTPGPLRGNPKGLAVSAQYLGSGDIDQRDENGNQTGTFTTTFAAYALAYGQQVSKKWSLGITGKLITEKISDVSAKAYATDLGVMYKPTDRLSIGSVVANVGSRLKFVNDSDPLPLAFRLGVLYRIRSYLDASVEGVYRQNAITSGHVGLEWKYGHILSLRGGYNTSHTKELSAASGLSGGVGIFLYGQEFAYAFVPFGDLGSTQYFSLVLRFSAQPPPNRPRLTTHEAYFEKEDPRSAEFHDLDEILTETEKKSLQQHRPASRTSHAE